MAEIWLSLLGEIDLSLGYVLGVGGAFATITLSVAWHWPWPLAFAASLALTCGMSLVLDFSFVLLKLPSFIVTLAGQIGFEGVLIYMVDKENSGGTVPVQNHVLYSLVNESFSPLWTWIIFAAFVGVASVVMLRSYRNGAPAAWSIVPFTSRSPRLLGSRSRP